MNKTKLSKIYKNNRSGMFYVSSGMVKTFIQAITGFIVLRWISPEEIGLWQSFTVFVGYISILTLGVTSGLSRDLPFWIGKGDFNVAMEKLKAAGAYISRLSLIIIVIVGIFSSISFMFQLLSLNQSIMLFSAFSIGAFSLQTNLLGATFRSDKAFRKLGYIQFGMACLHLVLLPIVYVYGIWGYVAYQLINTLSLLWGYKVFRPYRVNYKYSKSELLRLIKIGFPMYFWNYLTTISRTIPRLILIIFGSPFLVGLFAPAESINKAVLNLPNYIGRFIFPQMSFKYGKNSDINEVIRYTFKAATLLFALMTLISLILYLLIPYLMIYIFPKYVESTRAVQLIIFSGIFYSINSLMHSCLNSLKKYQFFKLIIPLKILSLFLFSGISYFISKNLLISVAVGALLGELINTIHYWFILKFKIQ